MLRLLPGEEVSGLPSKAHALVAPQASLSVSSSNTSSVMFVAQAVNRLKQLSTDHVAMLDSAPGVRPRRRSRVATDDGPADLRRQDQPQSIRWLPGHLWTKLLWLTDSWSSFRLLPYAMIQSRPLTESSVNKNEWMAWYSACIFVSFIIPFQLYLCTELLT